MYVYLHTDVYKLTIDSRNTGYGIPFFNITCCDLFFRPPKATRGGGNHFLLSKLSVRSISLFPCGVWDLLPVSYAAVRTKSGFECSFFLQHGERMHLNRLKLAIKYRQKKVTLIQYIFLMLPHVYIYHRRSTYIYSLIYYSPIAKSMNILCPFAHHNTLNRFMRIFQTYLISRRFRIMQAVKFSGWFRNINHQHFHI